MNEKKDSLEKQFKASERKYRALFEQAPYSVVLFNSEGFILDCNSTTEKIFGYTKEELIGTNYITFSFGMSADIPLLKERLEHLRHGEIGKPIEIQIQRKDGGVQWIRSTISKVALNDEEFIFQTVLQDITSQKKAKMKLTDIQARYDAMFRQNIYCIYVHDFNGQFLDANQAALDLLGYKREEIPSINVTKLLQNEGQLTKALLLLSNLKEKQFEAEPSLFKLIGKSGEPKWVEAQSTLILREGKPFAVQGFARDITGRVRAEEELRQSELKYRHLFENSPFAVILIDMRGDIIDINPALSKLVGYTKEDLIGTNIRALRMFPEQFFPLIAQKIQSILGEGETTPLELKVVRKTGETMWLFAQGSVINLGDKSIIQALAFDITDRKQAEEKLKESEEKYRLITENANDLITVHNQNRSLEYYNEKTHSRLLGYNKTEIGNIKYQNLFHPDDYNIIAEMMQGVFKEGTATGEIRFKKKDGSYLWVETVSKTFHDELGQMKTLTVARDLTERKRAEDALRASEDKYRNLVENVSEVIYVIDPSGTLTYVSPTVESFLGYKPLEIIQKPFSKHIYSEDLPRIMQSFQKLLAGASTLNEYRVVTKTGEIRWMRTSSSPIFEGDRVVEIHGVLIDITEKKKLEEARKNYMANLEKEVAKKTLELKAEKEELQKALTDLEATQEQLLQSEKLASIGLLAAGIAHEINNPLMGIINYAQIVQDELQSQSDINAAARPYSFLDAIVKEGERIGEIVQGLLTFAREDKGQYLFSDITELINSALSLLIPKIKQYQINIELNYDKNVPALPVQTRNIRQVFLNILQNSIDAINEKFTDSLNEEERKIVISTSLILKDRQKYGKITIWDNGIGIPDSYLQNVFDPFFSTKTATKEHGVGLGLSISYGIIADHNGEIQLKSVPREFTQIEIFLPVKPMEKSK